jgi:hypothetical protein
VVAGLTGSEEGYGRINWPFVFVWDHESDGRKWVANNLQRFVEQWFSGKLNY